MPADTRPDFSVMLGRRRYASSPQRVCWLITTGEALGPRDLLRPACGEPKCCRPDHQRVRRLAAVAAEAQALYRAGQRRSDIGRALGIPWSTLNRLVRGCATRRRAA